MDIPPISGYVDLNDLQNTVICKFILWARAHTYTSKKKKKKKKLLFIFISNWVFLLFIVHFFWFSHHFFYSVDCFFFIHNFFLVPLVIFHFSFISLGIEAGFSFWIRQNSNCSFHLFFFFYIFKEKKNLHSLCLLSKSVTHKKKSQIKTNQINFRR